MRFDFGCAKPLYARKIHPRILIGPAEIARLRRQTRRGNGRRILAAMRQRFAPVAERVLRSGDLPALLKFDGWHSFGWTASLAMRELAIIGILDCDADAIEAARRILLTQPERRLGYGFGPQTFDLIHEHLSPSERESFVAPAAAHVRRAVAEARPHYFKHAGHNMTIELALDASLSALLAIKGEPGAGDLDREEADLLRFFEATINIVFNVDGYPEEDIGYGTDVATLMALLAETLRRAGLFDIYRQCPQYARFGRAVLHFVEPWGGSLAMTGDHPNVFWFRQFFLARLAKETSDPSLRWLAGTLRHDRKLLRNVPVDGEIPLRKDFHVPAELLTLLVLADLKPAVHPAKTQSPTAFRDRGRGIVSFRSGWKADDTLVIFDGSQRSPSAQGHFHASGGHFSLSALGESFAIDMGRYNIEQNCHNVVLIDGKSGRSTNGEWSMTCWHGNLIDYQPGPFVDFAAADSSQQHNCYWARRFLGLVKGRDAPAYVWTVEDINKINDWAEFWWTLNTSPENVIKISGQTATVRGWRHGHLLDVHFALPAPSGHPRPHTLALSQDEATPSSHKYIGDPHARVKDYVRPAAMLNHVVFVRPRLIGKVSGYNGRFMSLLIPRRKGEAPAKVERLPSIDNSLAVKITFRDVEDTLIFAYEHNLLEAGDVKSCGQWRLVRRSRRTGRVLAGARGPGARMALKDRALMAN